MPRMPQSLPPGGSYIGEAVGELLGIEGNLDAPVTAVLPLGDRFAVTTGDGRVAFANRDFETADVHQVHAGAVLSAVVRGEGILSGGDDGRVTLTTIDGITDELWRAPPGRWIDHVAAGKSGVCAWACGNRVYLHMPGGKALELEHASSIGGLAFAPKSARLAVAHYGGVTVWDTAVHPPAMRRLEWKGMHLDISWSRDERFVVTAMQEGALHGWRLTDAADFQMSGYPTKPRSLDWSRKSDWLATSGANEILLWSFKGPKGPMGTSPDVLSRRSAPIAQVAFHPLNAYVAAGFQDGAVLLARQEDRRELMVRRAAGSPITGLAWSADGRRLAYGTEDGRASLADFSALEQKKGKKA